MEFFSTRLKEILNFPCSQMFTIKRQSFRNIEESCESIKKLKIYLKLVEYSLVSLSFDDLILFQKIWTVVKNAPPELYQYEKLSNQLKTVEKILELKLEFFQPYSLNNSDLLNFSELFSVFLNLANSNLPINQEKLTLCLQDFCGMKFWKSLHERELSVFIDLLISNKISKECRIIINKIFGKIPGSVDPLLTANIDLAGNVEKIKLGSFIDSGNPNILEQNAIVFIQNNQIPCRVIKKFTKEVVNKEKIFKKAEKIKKINSAAQGNVIKIFGYYNSCTYFKVTVKVIQKFKLAADNIELIKEINSESLVTQIRSLKESMKNLKKIDLLPKKLSSNHLALEKCALKLVNIHKDLEYETKERDDLSNILFELENYSNSFDLTNENLS